MELDHLAVCATSLEDGVAHVQDLLGINMVRGVANMTSAAAS